MTVFLPSLRAFINSHVPEFSAFLPWLEASLIHVPQVPTSAHPCCCTYSVCINGNACTNNALGIRPTSVSVQKSRNTSGMLTTSAFVSSLLTGNTAVTLQVSELSPKESAWGKKSAFRWQILCQPCEQSKKTPFFFIYTHVPGKQHSWPSQNPNESADIPHKLSASPSTCVCTLSADAVQISFLWNPQSV